MAREGRSIGERPIAVFVSSVHDYRMARRGSIQALADAVSRQGYDTRFISLRFSPLSLRKNDPRAFLWPRANRWEQQGDIGCYIWRTPFHPFASRRNWLSAAMAPAHDLYGAWPNGDIDEVIGHAALIIVESGLGAAFLTRFRRKNSAAKIIYLAADVLDVIGAHPKIQQRLEEAVPDIDHICLRARAMAPGFYWARDKTFTLPPGIHPPDFETIGPSPYGPGCHAVSVGAMLFDVGFVRAAAEAAPDINFHIIGCGQSFTAPDNVRLYDEMPFRETLPYLRHADIGLAPYRDAGSASYLAESSLKLAQYDYLGLPAVCPDFAVGAHPRRFGYRVGDSAAIKSALDAALRDPGPHPAPRARAWDDVALRLIAPQSYSDTKIDPADFDLPAQHSPQRSFKITA
jgi:2-beta-glucuronyltransferase